MEGSGRGLPASDFGFKLFSFLRLALAGGWTKIIFKLRILLEELSVVSLISRLVFNQTPEILK